MKRHGSDLKFCGCKQCRAVRRKKRGNDAVLRVRRHSRRKAKQQLKQGATPDSTAGVPYLG
jgi:hypothetical protein